MGSASTLTLANMFMWKREKARIDDIFSTSNKSIETTHKFLDKAHLRHPNIKMTRPIGPSVSYLDVMVFDNAGTRATSVYRTPAAEPFIREHCRTCSADIVSIRKEEHQLQATRQQLLLRPTSAQRGLTTRVTTMTNCSATNIHTHKSLGCSQRRTMQEIAQTLHYAQSTRNSYCS